MTVRRQVGEATTIHERNVESAIGRVPQWRGSEAAYAPLVGGLMNQNWLVEIAGDPRRYFIKVPGEGSEMFIDRVAANEAARNAHAMGIAPEVIFFDAQDGLEVSEFLEGYRACTNGDFGDSTIQSDVLGLYRRLHAGPKLSLTKTIFDMIEEHVEQGRGLGSHFPHDMSWIMHRPGEGRIHGIRARSRTLLQRPDAREFPYCRGAGRRPQADAADRLRVRLQQRAQL